MPIGYFWDSRLPVYSRMKRNEEWETSGNGITSGECETRRCKRFVDINHDGYKWQWQDQSRQTVYLSLRKGFNINPWLQELKGLSGYRCCRIRYRAKLSRMGQSDCQLFYPYTWPLGPVKAHPTPYLASQTPTSTGNQRPTYSSRREITCACLT